MGLGGPSAGTLYAAGDIPHVREHPLPTGDTRLPPGTLPFHWGHPAPTETGILSQASSNAPGRGVRRPLAQDVPGRGVRRPLAQDVPGVVECLRRRGTPLWAVPPQIEDVLFGRGLRSPTGSDDRAPVVWGRSTSWAENAVPDVPGRPCGAVVETGQSRPRACWSALPIWGCAARRAGPAARRRRRDRSGQVRDGRHNLMAVSTTGGGACIDCQDRPARLPGGVSTARTGARCPRWARLPVPGHSGIGFAPWLQDDASTPPPALRPCASGPRSRTRPAMERPTLLKDLPALKESPVALPPPVPPTGPPDVG